MGIKGKKEIIIRIIGIVLIMLSIPIEIINIFFQYEDYLTFLIYILIILPLIIHLIFQKFEVNLNKKWREGLFITSIGYYICNIIGLIILIDKSLMGFIYQMIYILIIFLLLNFSFSIQKRKKIFFLLLGLIFTVLHPIITYYIRMKSFDFFNSISYILVLLGFYLIIIIEYIMRREGLLRFL